MSKYKKSIYDSETLDNIMQEELIKVSDKYNIDYNIMTKIYTFECKKFEHHYFKDLEVDTIWLLSHYYGEKKDYVTERLDYYASNLQRQGKYTKP